MDTVAIQIVMYDLRDFDSIRRTFEVWGSTYTFHHIYANDTDWYVIMSRVPYGLYGTLIIDYCNSPCTKVWYDKYRN